MRNEDLQENWFESFEAGAQKKRSDISGVRDVEVHQIRPVYAEFGTRNNWKRNLFSTDILQAGLDLIFEREGTSHTAGIVVKSFSNPERLVPFLAVYFTTKIIKFHMQFGTLEIEPHICGLETVQFQIIMVEVVVAHERRREVWQWDWLIQGIL